MFIIITMIINNYCGMTSRLSQFLKTSLKNSSVEGPVERKMQDWTFGCIAFRIPRAWQSSMKGFATLMPNLTGTRSHSRSMASMKMTRSGCTQEECWTFSMAHLCRLYLQLLGGWERNA